MTSLPCITACGCADLRPEPNRIAKQTVPAQALLHGRPPLRDNYSAAVKRGTGRRPQARRRSDAPEGSKLLQLDGGTGFFELRLDLVGLVLCDAFLDRVRRAVD